MGIVGLSERYARDNNVTVAEARRTIMGVIKAIEDSIIDDTSGVKIVNHLTLKVATMRPHTCEHPVTGDVYDVPERKYLVARAGKGFSDKLNGK